MWNITIDVLTEISLLGRKQTVKEMMRARDFMLVNVKSKLIVKSIMRIGNFERSDVLIDFGKRTKDYE